MSHGKKPIMLVLLAIYGVMLFIGKFTMNGVFISTFLLMVVLVLLLDNNKE